MAFHAIVDGFDALADAVDCIEEFLSPAIVEVGRSLRWVYVEKRPGMPTSGWPTQFEPGRPARCGQGIRRIHQFSLDFHDFIQLFDEI